MMKVLCLLIAITCGMSACSKQNQVNQVPATDNIDTSKGAIKYSGMFSSAPGESVSGNALVLFQNGVYSIALENMNVGNGPDLHLYLSKELKPLNFIDVSKLKSTSGNQVYALTSIPNFTQYKYVLVFCQQYNVLFGSAVLK